MNIKDLNTIEQLEQFLTGSQAVAFLVASSTEECYQGIQRILVKFRYPSLNKRSKGVVVRFLVKITGYPRQQITRLVKQYRDTGKIERQQRAHQGDQDKQKGVYHINADDEVTQFEVVCTVEKISEQYLIPAIEQILDCFPFVIKGFHSDNGSEYINYKVADLLQKLLIEFTKSRSRQTNNNALVESKNGFVIRKLFGYAHIPQRWAPVINQFNHDTLFPYINYISTIIISTIIALVSSLRP